MDKQFQLELFNQQRYSFNKAGTHSNYFSLIKLHEKTILIIVALLIISCICFSLGVEKGKRLTANKSKEPRVKPAMTAPMPKYRHIEDTHQRDATFGITDEKKESQEKRKENREEKQKYEEEISSYTVQVASFKTRVYAQKEAERLEKKGLKPITVSKGDFICIYVGNFSDKQQAGVALKDLKKIYKDCFIRRL